MRQVVQIRPVWIEPNGGAIVVTPRGYRVSPPVRAHGLGGSHPNDSQADTTHAQVVSAPKRPKNPRRQAAARRAWERRRERVHFARMDVEAATSGDYEALSLFDREAWRLERKVKGDLGEAFLGWLGEHSAERVIVWNELENLPFPEESKAEYLARIEIAEPGGDSFWAESA